MSASLRRLAERVRRENGMTLGEPQLTFLRAVVLRAGGVSPEEFDQELGNARRAPALISRLIDEVTVKETFLFRHPTELFAIDAHARASNRSSLRVWCAACSTGEEA